MRELSGKIILIDDEPFELDLLNMALKDLEISVDIKYFTNGEDALDYLRETTDPIFLIISDMNMPKLNGLDIKKIIDQDPELCDKAVPFIFLSTAATKNQLREAYEYRLQGYFIKASDVSTMAKQLELIINYWIVSVRPDSDDFGNQDRVFNLKDN